MDRHPVRALVVALAGSRRCGSGYGSAVAAFSLGKPTHDVCWHDPFSRQFDGDAANFLD